MPRAAMAVVGGGGAWREGTSTTRCVADPFTKQMDRMRENDVRVNSSGAQVALERRT
jgi:hypothetical protein